LECWNKP